MKFLTDPLIKSANDVADLSVRLADNGLEFLTTTVGSIPLFAGTKVYVAEEGMEADETHYFLIPFRAVERGYAIGTRRVLPEGIGPENDLPKRRVFHLPRNTEIEALEKFLVDDLAEENLALVDSGSDLADRLDAVANEIDKKSSFVTGGLLVIGGAVAIANPLIGVGIAAKALIPGVGAILSREGLTKFGDVLRKKRADDVEDQVGKSAEKEVKKMKPEVHENGLLSLLEESVSSSDPGFDPMMQDPGPIEGTAAMRVRSITAEAILNAYCEVLDAGPQELGEARLDAPDVKWLRSLDDLVVARNMG